MKIYFKILIFFISISFHEIHGQIIMDTIHIDSSFILYKSCNLDSITPINLKLYDCINGKCYYNSIDDLSQLVQVSLSSFKISTYGNREFVLEYVDHIMGNSYCTYYHVFERSGDVFYFTKEYVSYTNRNEYQLMGSLLSKKIDFKNYIPIDVESNKKVTISSFYGFQEQTEPDQDLFCLQDYEKKISYFSENKYIDSIAIYYDTFILKDFLSNYYKQSRNQAIINNIGYYLEENKFYYESIFVLKQLLQYFPRRTVAYLNLGDAYWGIEETNNANQAYKKYIELMKEKGWESKIPKRISERVNIEN